MKKIDTYYITTSYGGTEKRCIKTRTFKTKQEAKDNAKNDKSNNTFTWKN